MTHALESEENLVTPTSIIPRGRCRLANVTAIALLMLLLPALADAQGDGARFHWTGLVGTNVVPVVYNTFSGNSNPFDPSQTPAAGATIDGTLALAGYARVISLFDRSASIAFLVPMGSLSEEVNVGGKTTTESAGGFGDPMVQFGVNLIGPKPIKNIPDILRYEPGLSIDLIGSLSVPLGEYHNTQTLNVGQNRFYGRVGAAVVWQLGSWAPEQRTTLEFLPAAWFFSDNNDFVGKTMSTEPMFQLEGHLTRNFTKSLWGAFDAIWWTGGKATIDGVAGEKVSNAGLGFTLGYQINDNLQITAGYASSVHDELPSDLKWSQFRVSLTYGWHPLIEGMNRLGGK